MAKYRNICILEWSSHKFLILRAVTNAVAGLQIALPAPIGIVYRAGGELRKCLADMFSTSEEEGLEEFLMG